MLRFGEEAECEELSETAFAASFARFASDLVVLLQIMH